MYIDIEEIVKASYFDRMLESLLMHTTYEKLTNLSKLKVTTITKERNSLSNRIEC